MAVSDIIQPDTEADRYEVETLLPWRVSTVQYTAREEADGSVRVIALRRGLLVPIQRRVELPGCWRGERS